jgi:uncharacterized LabA/DUF88 family protein
MVERVGIFIDGANIFYGMKGKLLDFEKFKSWLADGREATEASYFNACQKDNEEMQKFFNYVKATGFKVYVKQTTLNSVTHEYKQAGIDVYLTVKALRFNKNYDTFILVSGDYDYIPLIEELKRFNKKIEVVSFKDCLHPIYKADSFNVRYMEDFLEEKNGR